MVQCALHVSLPGRELRWREQCALHLHFQAGNSTGVNNALYTCTSRQGTPLEGTMRFTLVLPGRNSRNEQGNVLYTCPFQTGSSSGLGAQCDWHFCIVSRELGLAEHNVLFTAPSRQGTPLVNGAGWGTLLWSTRMQCALQLIHSRQETPLGSLGHNALYTCTFKAGNFTGHN